VLKYAHENGCPWNEVTVKKQLREVILMCSSTCMRTAAPGMNGLVKKQLRRVIWMCSSTCMKTAALGMSRLV